LVGGNWFGGFGGTAFLVFGSCSWGEGWRFFHRVEGVPDGLSCVDLGNDGINVSPSVLRGNDDGYQVRSAKQNL
jgi:hypothetical protein